MAAATKRKSKIVNGINPDAVRELAAVLQNDPAQGVCKFHIQNKWQRGGYNRTRIKSFLSGGTEVAHLQAFQLEADEPPVLAGRDKAPNPVEHLLNALAACLTTSMVYHAALQGIKIESLESELQGDLDLRGFLGVSDQVRKGYQRIQVTFRVKTDAENLESLRAFAQFSPVFDVVRNGTSVDLQILKK